MTVEQRPRALHPIGLERGGIWLYGAVRQPVYATVGTREADHGPAWPHAGVAQSD